MAFRTPVSRAFSSTASTRAHRALVYTSKGEPSAVLKAVTFPTLPTPASGTLNIRYLLSPVNPADVNTVQGVYPAKPSPAGVQISQAAPAEGDVFVGGHEAVAEVTAVGDGVSGLARGDWVVMAKAQSGTWASAASVSVEDVIKLQHDSSLSEAQVAMLTVNPPTAWNMLHDYVDLSPGDWVLQNGANSAVGQNVIQIAAHRGLKTLNFIRNRDNFETAKQRLISLGGTHVFTYDDLSDKSRVAEIKSLIGLKAPRLFLNCVGGEATTKMLRLVGSDAHLVTYGAMARAPLSLPAGVQIFQGLTAHGFWQSRWYKSHSRTEREELFAQLTELMRNGKLKEADHEIVTLSGKESDEGVTKQIRDAMRKMEGGFGKKILLKIEDPVN